MYEFLVHVSKRKQQIFTFLVFTFLVGPDGLGGMGPDRHPWALPNVPRAGGPLL